MGDTQVLRRAGIAVATVFFLAGLVIAGWLSRIPQIRDDLALTPGALGRVLLALAVGSIIALPTAGLVVNRIGARRAVATGVMLGAVGLAAAATGAGALGSMPLMVAGLFVVGYGVGTWDVAMNVAGAALERRRGRALMPHLHAGFSLGAAAGAGTGAVAAAGDRSVVGHLAGVSVLIATVGTLATRWFLPATPAPPATSGSPASSPVRRTAGSQGVWATWREPRTLLIGVFVLTFALSEGIAYDWLAVALVDGFGVGNAQGAVGLAVFVTAMTATRLLGAAAVDRFGRVPVLRTSALLAIAGVLLVVFGGAVPVALVGALVWGAGTALGFPVGMSAGADDPARASLRVSVIASVAYTAFLAGPPLLGWLGDHIGVHRALLVTVAALAVGVLAAGANRPTAV